MEKSEKTGMLPLQPEGREERGITRREFLMGTAGFVLLCGTGFGLRGLAELAEPETPPIGPQLREELDIVPTAEGADALVNGETCFTVNREGLKLLRLADGRHTLNEIIRDSGLDAQAEAVVDFFLALGYEEYLTARLEVNKIAVAL